MSACQQDSVYKPVKCQENVKMWKMRGHVLYMTTPGASVAIDFPSFVLVYAEFPLVCYQPDVSACCLLSAEAAAARGTSVSYASLSTLTRVAFALCGIFINPICNRLQKCNSAGRQEGLSGGEHIELNASGWVRAAATAVHTHLVSLPSSHSLPFLLYTLNLAWTFAQLSSLRIFPPTIRCLPGFAVGKWKIFASCCVRLLYYDPGICPWHKKKNAALRVECATKCWSCRATRVDRVGWQIGFQSGQTPTL